MKLTILFYYKIQNCKDTSATVCICSICSKEIFPFNFSAKCSIKQKKLI